MRIRALKPEFFLHEGIAALTPQARIFYSGLWCVADREGRFLWRPKRLKAEIFPYDDFDTPAMLEELRQAQFIRRYEVGDRSYGVIESWERNQVPARDEPPSDIPAPDGSFTAYSLPPNQTVRARIYQRDNYRCVYCGKDMTRDVRSRCLDHVIPYSRGGTNNEKNLVTACKTCNAAKGARTPAEAGLSWPDGIGEQYDVVPPVTPPLTVCDPPVNGVLTPVEMSAPLREGEWEGELEKGSGVGSTDAAPRLPVPCRATDLMDLWNVTTLPPIIRCRHITDGRRQKIRARMGHRQDLAEWREIFERIQASAFCRGEVVGRDGKTPWIADFDWIIANDTNPAKVLEGKYDDRAGPTDGRHGVVTALTSDNMNIRDRLLERMGLDDDQSGSEGIHGQVSGTRGTS